ncbi:hypothetical protein OG948_34520 (plasmid) [Embleya sp. NBC_00888]|uniref:hypothetical protein n=1 Tax=Embleya sp. NBC_00888 TaxID=2975960 RepID=UPI002F9161BF|nr:hypothetical protein OG948_34520 [Embleya sp. NBC_00888]
MHPAQPPKPSRRAVLGGIAAAGAATALGSFTGRASTAHAATAAGTYTVRFDQARRQTIKGLGVEIQADSIGSGNNGLPDTVSGVPLDLTPAERTRFYAEILKGTRSDRGFRYCRLAMGLYYRGLDPTRKLMQDRYPGQRALLADMQDRGGLEGMAVEYWSPAPGWKSSNSFVGGRLKSFEPAFLSEFGDALVADLDHLRAGGLRISHWGLQNEPAYGDLDYSSCTYSPQEYLATFKAVAPKIRAAYPDVLIHAESLDGWTKGIGQALKADAEAMRYVDAWTFHHLHDANADKQLANNYTSGALGKPVFSNEFEYLDGPASDRRCINNAQSIMNWMTFQESPTWFWLHALKPIANAEASGYSLGFWRPPNDTDFSRFPDLAPGHWTYNQQNWNGIAGFVKYMPWDSVRYTVDESQVRLDQRIMAWKTAAGKAVVALTNRSATDSFTFTIDTQTAATFQGNRYTPQARNTNLGTKSGPTLTVTLPPHSVEFWIRTP